MCDVPLIHGIIGVSIVLAIALGILGYLVWKKKKVKPVE